MSETRNVKRDGVSLAGYVNVALQAWQNHNYPLSS